MLKDFKDPDESVYYLISKDTCVEDSNVFLVGKFDIEDSISDKYWINLVKDLCGVTLDTSDIEEIRNNLASDSEKKFLKLLRDKVSKDENKTDYLPSKKDCALYMAEAITDKNDIPADITKLFKEIESDNSK